MTYMTMYERVITKIGHQIFGHEESASPPRENPGYAYALLTVIIEHMFTKLFIFYSHG